MHASAFHVGILAIPFVVAEQHHATRPRQTGSTTTPSRVESGINTECKTCPYELCINAAAYDSSTDLTLTCWTRGETIVDTNLWYKTTDGCYVTEWDIIEGNYTGVISYCGEVEETYTQGPSRTVFNTECNIVPDFVPELADHTKMYQPDIDLTLTCYTDDGSQVLGNSRWYKTLSNCYVPEAQIEFVEAHLDNCGPIPFMEAKMRQPDAEEVPAANFTRRGDAEDEKRWLYLTQIGEDSADCLSQANSASEVETSYPFGYYIVVQCATYSENPADDNEIFLLTEDFCWVNDTLTDPQLIDSEIRSQRYPNCNLFVDNEV